MLTLDHIAVSATKLGDVTNLPLQPGGEHPLMGTHNRLLALGPEYLEVIAINPLAPRPDRPRWFSLDEFRGRPRLTTWICRTDHLDQMVARFPDAGRIIAFERGPYRWRMAVPDSGNLGFDGVFPALIQWDEGHPAGALIEQNHRLKALEISHPKADDLAAQLTPVLADSRITFTTGPAGLIARLTTPQGEHVLI